MSGLGDSHFLVRGRRWGLGVRAGAPCEASGSGVLRRVARSCDVGWVGGKSEVVKDMTDELGLAHVREEGAGAGASAGTGEDVVELDALDKRSPVHASGPRGEESGAKA